MYALCRSVLFSYFCVFSKILLLPVELRMEEKGLKLLDLLSFESASNHIKLNQQMWIIAITKNIIKAKNRITVPMLMTILCTLSITHHTARAWKLYI